MDDNGRRRLRRHLDLIDAGTKPVVERYRDHIQCQKGCSDCCHQSFAISEVEGAYLREGLDAADPDVRAGILTRARAYQPGQRQPCPVLSEEGGCQLYEHRPRICRKYGIVLWNPEEPERVTTCPKNFVGVSDIDTELVLDPQAEWARDWIRLRSELGLPTAAPRPIAAHLLE